MHATDRLVPTLFHRRLILLACGCVLVSLGLGGQMVRLAVVEGSERLAEAEARLNQRTYLPTFRGRILDRKGRILARDRASYDIALDYDVITGAWVRSRAARQARREIGVSRWNSMSPELRELAIDERLPHWQAKADRLWSEIMRLGEIDEEELVRRRDAIRAEVQSAAASTWEAQRERWRQRFGVDDDDDETVGGFRPRPILEQRQPHVILPRVPDEVAFEFERLGARGGEGSAVRASPFGAESPFEGVVHVIASRRRETPWSSAEVTLDRGQTLPKPLQSLTPATIRVDGIADHIIGAVREHVWAEDVARRPFVHPVTGEIDLAGYRPGDSVGSRGLERAFEHHLRGKRGRILERKDTGEQVRTEPAPGSDLQTTLDIVLQARIQALLSHEYGLTRVQRWHHNSPDLPIGTPLNAAAVVMEVESGEVLAMVSMPTIAMGRAMSEAHRRLSDPWVNRAAEAIYPPGSIIKPLVLSAAVKESVHTLGAAITCRGHYFDHLKETARCWIYRERFGMQSHGPLHAEEALARSCNVYFYTLGDRLGMRRLAEWFRRFGMGAPLDAGLLVDGLGEAPGQVPVEEQIADLRRRGSLEFDSVIMGIGQGPVTWTPLQAANAYAMIARGGSVRDATLVQESAREQPRPLREDVRLAPELVRAILEGLRQSVEEPHGTGYRITYDADPSLTPDRTVNADGVTVWAKTGTAQAPPLRLPDFDGESERRIDGLSHAWFVGLVGPKGGKPAYSIAVLVEYGGSGGRVSGPIANQIIRALQAEGYLPGGEIAPGGGRG
jgi:penicillin-binding protein 2